MAPTNDESPRQTSLVEIIDVIWRRRALVAVCLAGVLAPILIANVTTPPVYQAQATLIFERGQDPLPSFSASQPYYWDRSYMVNQIEELRSWALAEQAAAKLDDTTAAALLRGRSVQPRPTAQLAGIIKGSISAEPVRDSDVFRIRAAGPTPASAARVANLVAQVVIERNAMVRRRQAASTRKFIEEQMPAVEANLARTEEAINNFKSANQVMSLSDEAREMLARVTNAEQQYTTAATERQGIEKKTTAIRDQLKLQSGSVETEIASGSVAEELRKTLVALQMEVIQLTVKGYGPQHPKQALLQEQIAATKAKLRTELEKINKGGGEVAVPQLEALIGQLPGLEIDLAMAQAREMALRQILAGYEGKLSRLPRKELELARLTREKEVNENIYKLLLEKGEEAKITEAGSIGSVRVIDFAKMPGAPISPRRMFNALIGLVVGLALGVGLSFFLDSLDYTVKSADDVERQFALTILGMIPAIHADNGKPRARRDDRSEVERISSTLVTRYTPQSPISEAYRTLRTNIQFSRIDSPLKTLVLSSSLPSEGKSTTVANLAITTAQTGARTLLVDADLRRPVVHSLFGLEREPGMINLLAERLPLEKVLKPSGIPYLDILTCGAIPPNPSELLGSQKMRELVAALAGRYDVVLFDSPPVMTVTDTAVLGTQTDGVALVVVPHATDRRALERTKTLLANVKVNILGAVINRIEVSSLGGKYDYYYHYHYYYAEDGEKKHRHRAWWERLIGQRG